MHDLKGETRLRFSSFFINGKRPPYSLPLEIDGEKVILSAYREKGIPYIKWARTPNNRNIGTFYRMDVMTGLAEKRIQGENGAGKGKWIFVDENEWTYLLNVARALR